MFLFVLFTKHIKVTFCDDVRRVFTKCVTVSFSGGGGGESQNGEKLRYVEVERAQRTDGAAWTRRLNQTTLHAAPCLALQQKVRH